MYLERVWFKIDLDSNSLPPADVGHFTWAQAQQIIAQISLIADGHPLLAFINGATHGRNGSSYLPGPPAHINTNQGSNDDFLAAVHAVRERVFCNTISYQPKMITLPRQARDKRRESTQNKTCVLQANTRYNTVVGMNTNMVSGMPVVRFDNGSVGPSPVYKEETMCWDVDGSLQSSGSIWNRCGRCLFGAPFYTKNRMYLPRQAREKHRKSLGVRKMYVFLNAGILRSARPRSTASTLPRTPRMCSLDFSRSGSSVHCAATPDR